MPSWTSEKLVVNGFHKSDNAEYKPRKLGVEPKESMVSKLRHLRPHLVLLYEWLRARCLGGVSHNAAKRHPNHIIDPRFEGDMYFYFIAVAMTKIIV